MMRDRLALYAAYGLLVFVVAWSAWDTQRTLDRIEEDVCATAEVVVANELVTLAVFAGQDGVNSTALRVAIETYTHLADAISDRCGLIFLDEIEVPTVDVTKEE